MEFFNVTPNPIYGKHNPVGLKYLTRLRVGLSHLRDQDHFSDTSSTYPKLLNIIHCIALSIRY